MDYEKYHRDDTYKKFEDHFRNIFMKRFFTMKRFAKEGRVLEIGCSTGVMLDIFRENNWETWGVEPSESAELAKSKRHKILNTYFERAKLPSIYFDCVVANHTLEHMDDPLGVLKKANRILKKDGYILIDVPNAGGWGSKVLGDRWPYRLPLEHKSQFTKDSLSKLFKESGFDVVYFESRSGIFEFYDPLLEIRQSFIGMKKRFFTNLINIPYDIFVTSSNMGDSMTMIGKKI